ncbi:MAG: Carbamoyl-phosphate synthase large chain [Lentisphaerae bacterium ADurb.BinA184]|nr:MAG: Carbamoyl-phosphate synthase large chain [Lentisphaerae bacterium ADurb.BinA184]
MLHIYTREKCWGCIVQFGGQTPLNLARALESNGVNIIGTSPASIEAAEDRESFEELVTQLGIRQPQNGTATTVDGALAAAHTIGYPVLVRPSFVLGGRAMAIVYDDAAMRRYAAEAVEVSESRPILIDRFLEDAIEVDVDCIADGETAVIGAIMEHVEQAGVHSGDSACIIAPVTLDGDTIETIRRHTHALARGLNVVGLMNVQYAVQGHTVYVLEVNPRASRTVPFASKATGVPLAKLAALVMTGRKLRDLGFSGELHPRHYSVKEAVLPFIRFQGADILLSPEMKSTGEVMGIDLDDGIAFLKSQMAAGTALPDGGNVFISVSDHDKPEAVRLARELEAMGYVLYATRGTATALREAGIQARALFRISEGRPNVLDLMRERAIGWIVNSPSGAAPRADEVRMRADALRLGIPITTTLSGLRAAVKGLKAFRCVRSLDVCSLQEYQRHTDERLRRPAASAPVAGRRRGDGAPA